MEGEKEIQQVPVQVVILETRTKEVISKRRR